MPDCVCLPKCPFFNDTMPNMPLTADWMKTKYCKGDFENCARYMIFSTLGREQVPANMAPNQQDKAKAIIAAG